MLETPSTTMQVWSRVYIDLDSAARSIGEEQTSVQEPEPETGPKPKLGLRSELFPLLVGLIVGVATPPMLRRRGHATLCLRECIAHLRSKAFDLVSLD